MDSSRDTTVRVAAIRAASLIEGTDETYLLDLLGDPDSGVRAAGAYILCQLQEKQAQPIVRSMFYSNDPATRDAALVAASVWPEAFGHDLAQLARRKDSSPEEKISALAAVGSIDPARLSEGDLLPLAALRGAGEPADIAEAASRVLSESAAGRSILSNQRLETAKPTQQFALEAPNASAYRRAAYSQAYSHWYSLQNPSLVQAWTSVLSLIVGLIVAALAFWYTSETRQMRLDDARQFGVSIAPQLRVTGFVGQNGNAPSFTEVPAPGFTEVPAGAAPPILWIMNEGPVAARPLVFVKLDHASANAARYAADFGKAGIGVGEELAFFLNTVISYKDLVDEFANRFGRKELFLLEKYIRTQEPLLAVFVMDQIRQIHVYTWHVNPRKDDDFEMASSWEEDRPYLRRSKWVIGRGHH